MNCHVRVKTQSPLAGEGARKLRDRRADRWVQVHRLPDYVYFNHQAHVTAG